MSMTAPVVVEAEILVQHEFILSRETRKGKKKEKEKREGIKPII